MFLLILLSCCYSLVSSNEERNFGDFLKCTKWLRTDGSDCNVAIKEKELQVKQPMAQMLFSFFPTEKCCENGSICFSRAKGTPFECNHELPACMDVVQPKFLLYTPINRQMPYMLDYFNLEKSINDLNLPTNNGKFFAISHGFGGTWSPNSWMTPMKDRLLDLGNTVLLINWTGGSKAPFYFKSAATTRSVGAALAKVMQALSRKGKISLDDATIVGFSLGGHVAGFAGARLPGLKRIIALDPAGPLFQCMDPEARLNPSNAKFVQAIHSSGDFFLQGGAGTLQQFGHMDIYMNGGSRQPGCPNSKVQDLKDLMELDFGQMVDDVACSHIRMPKLFIEMVANAKFPEKLCQYHAFPCKSKKDWQSGKCFNKAQARETLAGYLTDLHNKKEGTFYVTTQSDNVTSGEYCGRQYLLSIESDSQVAGELKITLAGNRLKSETIKIQTLSGSFPENNRKTVIIAVPWKMNKIDQISIEFKQNLLTRLEDSSSWVLKSINLIDIDGNKFFTNVPKTIEHGSNTIMNIQSQY